MFNFNSSHNFNVSSQICCVSNLRTEAIKEAKPYVHKSKTTGLKQEVAQEVRNAVVWPVAVDEEQSLQESKLGQCEICVLHWLTALYSC